MVVGKKQKRVPHNSAVECFALNEEAGGSNPSGAKGVLYENDKKFVFISR